MSLSTSHSAQPQPSKRSKRLPGLPHWDPDLKLAVHNLQAAIWHAFSCAVLQVVIGELTKQSKSGPSNGDPHK